MSNAQSIDSPIPPHHLSIVVPFYNEEENIVPLVKRVHEALADYANPWELVLVDDGTAVDYPGSVSDYIDFILGRNQPRGEARPKGEKKDRKAIARAREEARQTAKDVADAEAAIAGLQAQVSAVDRAMFDPATAEQALAKLTMGDLASRRASLASDLQKAEERWLAASERREQEAA